ncbi:MAG: M48 family metallopeptidase [Alphaproteobacteria bacterium]|nr:M48 family metallopeptidase [Alphaproteobacteria bacterium]
MKITLLSGRIFEVDADLGFDMKVVHSNRSRRLTLRIDKKDRIAVLTIPKYCSRKKAVSFVESHQDWVLDNLRKIPEFRKFQNNEEISLFGKTYQIVHTDIRGNTRLDRKNKILYISGSEEFLHRRVKDFIKKLAHQEFEKRSKDVAEKIGKTVHNVCIKDTKSRWASCSTLNNINYSWRLALAPEYVIRYIVAHEVSHLKHQDHSAYFWALVEYLEKDANKGKEWLTENGHSLYMYK